MNLVLEYIHYKWKNTFSPQISDETQAKIKNCVSFSNTVLAYENDLKVFRNFAKSTTRKINVIDFGAGSKKMGSERSIQNIYRTSRSTISAQRMLYQLIREFKCKNVLEMGTSLGFTTVYLSKGNEQGNVTTLEACPATALEAKQLFDKLNLKNVELICSTFSDYFEKNTFTKYDLVFVDGHHDGEALLNYMNILLNRSLPGCIYILDDIRWSDSMYSAWQKLIQKTEFEFHIDLFRIGILVKKESTSECRI